MVCWGPHVIIIMARFFFHQQLWLYYAAAYLCVRAPFVCVCVPSPPSYAVKTNIYRTRCVKSGRVVAHVHAMTDRVNFFDFATGDIAKKGGFIHFGSAALIIFFYIDLAILFSFGRLELIHAQRGSVRPCNGAKVFILSESILGYGKFKRGGSFGNVSIRNYPSLPQAAFVKNRGKNIHQYPSEYR